MKYPGLKKGTKEYNRAKYICKKYSITFVEYKANEDKYKSSHGNTHSGDIGSKEYNRSVWLKHKYNITTEEYDKMLAEQDYRCAICKGSLEMDRIDHCHKTGKVRGILCNDCNLGLGLFRDNKDYLKSAIEYLGKM